MPGLLWRRRHVQFQFLAFTRAFRGSATVLSKSLRPSHILKQLKRATNDPVYGLVEELRNPQARKPALSKLCDSAHGESTGALIGRNFSTDISRPLEPWQALYHVAYRVKSTEIAQGDMMTLVKSFMDRDTPETRTYSAPLILVSSLHLAHYNLVLQLQSLANSFFQLPLPPPPSQSTETYFNLLLDILTFIPAFSPQKTKLILDVIQRMEARQIKLSPSTYTLLLKDRHITLELTSLLRDRMIRQGFVPEPEHLEAHLRIFGKFPNKSSLARPMRASSDGLERRISAQSLPEGDWDYAHALKPLVKPSFEVKSLYKTAKKHNFAHTSQTLRLRASPDRASAFEYLNRLLATQKHSTRPSPWLIRRTMDPAKYPARNLLLPSFRAQRKLRVDIHDFTAALQAAARDSSTSARTLLRLFLQATQRHPAFRPTATTYAVVLRGLLHRDRGAHDLARQVFARFTRSGLPMNGEVLKLGMRALVQGGHSQKALGVLAYYTGVGLSSERAALHRRLGKSVRVDAGVANALLAALMRENRPDVVFQVWDALPGVFGCVPDETGLCVLMRSARLAKVMDDRSISAVLRNMARMNPFRSKKTSSSYSSSTSAGQDPNRHFVESVEKLVGMPDDPEPKPYVSGLWRDERAVDIAYGIFVRALFGHAIAQGGPALFNRLASTEPPAHPVRANDERPYLASYRLPLFSVPEDVLNPRGQGWFPGVVLSDRAFREFLLLLAWGAGPGEVGKGEVPRALAWMRVLGVEPSADTLSAAMLLFGEVGMSRMGVSPVDIYGKRIGGKGEWWSEGGKTQYECFVEWIKGWVGEERLPKPRELRRWIKRVNPEFGMD